MPHSPDAALQKLIEGNQRFVAARGLPPHIQVSGTEKPFAAVLSCSDARLPPEVLFDCGWGELFSIRTAGHVVDSAVLGSVAYAVEQMNVALVVVLSQERCGAVKAYVESCARHGTQVVHRVRGHLHELVEGIAPAAKAAHERCGDLVENTMREHVRLTVERLVVELPRLQARLEHHRVGLIGAYHDLESGKIEITIQRGFKVPAQ